MRMLRISSAIRTRTKDRKLATWKKLTVLALLSTFLVGVWAYQAEPAAAAPLCNICMHRMDECVDDCPSGPSLPACMSLCAIGVETCFRACRH